MADPRHVVLAVLLPPAIASTGCETADRPPAGGPDADGPVAAIELLDGGEWVSFDGRRTPLDRFLYDARVNARRPAGDPERWAAVSVRAGPVGSAVIDRLIDQLKKAGVPEVRFEERR